MSGAPIGLARSIRWRLAIPTILFMFLSSLDRVNVSFAAIHMNADLGFTPSQYGFGAGILFFGFLAGQYPSILLLQKIGFRRWMSFLAIVWGLAATGMAFIETHNQFYALRVFIGFAEGGLAPGIVLYLGQFATERERATTFALPMMAIPLSIIFGGPLSGWLLDMTPPAGLTTWRWMFIAEGLPTVLFGIAAYFYFPDSPAEVRWMSDADKSWLAANSANRRTKNDKNDWSIMLSPIVWSSALLWFCLLSGAYGIMFWLPQMVHQMAGLSGFQTGLVNALPWIGVGIGIYFNSAHSDKTGERFWHVGLPAVITALAIAGAGAVGPGPAGLVLLFVAGLGLGAAQGAFWALPTALFTGTTMAIGVVTINIAGSSGGAVVPHLIGFVREQTGSFAAPTLIVAAVLLLASLIVVFIRFRLFAGKATDAA